MSEGKSIIPKELAAVKLAVGDKNENGKVDISSTLSFRGRELPFGDRIKDVELGEAMDAIAEAREFLEKRLGRK